MAGRIKISACYNDLNKELYSLIRLDQSNQSRSNLSTRQLHLLTEGIFLSAFRAYENYLEETFLLYTLEKKTLSGSKPRSYLKPKNFNHSRDLIRSSMPFLDWSSPVTLIDRAETYLEGGEPIKSTIASARNDLMNMKTLRNQIAHNSVESRPKYIKLLRDIYSTNPLKIPAPGELLLTGVRNSSPREHYLSYYINKILTVGQKIAYGR